MKTNLPIEQAKRLPDTETEVLWYLNKYGETYPHPIENIIDSLYIDFDIRLPELNGNTSKRLLVGLTVLVREYELIQGNLPGSYHLHVEGFGRLDEIEDVSTYILYSFLKIITHYFLANKKEELETLEIIFLNEVKKWNWHAWVKQEEVINLLGSQLKMVGKRVSIQERKLPEVLHDYYSRIDRIQLENLESFLQKSEGLLNNSHQIKSQAQFFSYILDEVKNGGENLHSVNDILPHFSGLKYN